MPFHQIQSFMKNPCHKGSCAEGRVAVPTGRRCKAWFGMNYLPVLGPSGQGRVGDRSRRRQAHRASRRVGPTPGNAGKPGGAARRDPETNMRVFYDAGLY